MSPEQGRGRPVDARSDIYALGVVVYELFTGRVPFHADTPIATLMMHVEAPPPLDDPALPPAVVAVLRRALAKDPGDRFPTAQAMADALRGRADAAARAAARRAHGAASSSRRSSLVGRGWHGGGYPPARRRSPVASPVPAAATRPFPSPDDLLAGGHRIAGRADRVADTGRDDRAVLRPCGRRPCGPVPPSRDVEPSLAAAPPRPPRPRRRRRRARSRSRLRARPSARAAGLLVVVRALGGRQRRRRAPRPDASRAARGDAGRAPGRAVPPRLPAVGAAGRSSRPGRRSAWTSTCASTPSAGAADSAPALRRPPRRANVPP